MARIQKILHILRNITPPLHNSIFIKKNIPTLSKLRANILYTTSNFAQGARPQENATLKKAPFFLKKNHLQFQHKNFFENKKSNSIKIFKHSIPHKKSNINYVTPKKFLYLSSLTRSFADYVIQKRNVQLPIHLFDKHLTVIPRVIKRIRASRATYKKSTTTKQKNSSIFSSIFRNKLRTTRDHFAPIPYQPLAYSTSQLRATDDLKTINPKISHEFLRNSYNFPQIMHMEHSNFQNQKFSTVYQPSISEFADAVTSHLINGLSAAPTNSTLSWPQAVPSYPGWHA
ncbi:hypothetical protein [Acetobacter nitrogenifigens]|uniref:hypothetical protein n=1 Tax=Acetobacter nitrogenifigens TaxID=285268 RepID=UPI0011BF991C|nr:hypothetical protein [Acetobacter nitrogenifigens]